MFFDAATDEVVLRIVYEGGDAEPRAMLTEVSRSLWVDRGEVELDPSERLAHIEHAGGVVRGVCLRNQLVACSAESLGDEAFGELIEQADALVLVGPWNGASKRSERLERLTRVLTKQRPRGSVVMPTTAEVVDHVSTLALAAGDAWHGASANDVKRASVEAFRTTLRRLAKDLQPERLVALPPLSGAAFPRLVPAKPQPKKPESKKIQPPRIFGKKKVRSNATTTGPLPPPPVPGSARPTPRPRTTKPRPPKIRSVPVPAIPETVTKIDSKPPVATPGPDTSYNFSARPLRKAPKTDLAALFENELPSQPDDSGSKPIIAAAAPPPQPPAEPESIPEPEPEPGAPVSVQGEITARLTPEVIDEPLMFESREPSVELKTRTLSEPGVQASREPAAVDSETARIVQPAAVMRSRPAPVPTTALARTASPETTISWWASFARWFVQLFGGKRSTQ